MSEVPASSEKVIIPVARLELIEKLKKNILKTPGFITDLVQFLELSDNDGQKLATSDGLFLETVKRVVKIHGFALLLDEFLLLCEEGETRREQRELNLINKTQEKVVTIIKEKTSVSEDMKKKFLEDLAINDGYYQSYSEFSRKAESIRRKLAKPGAVGGFFGIKPRQLSASEKIIRPKQMMDHYKETLGKDKISTKGYKKKIEVEADQMGIECEPFNVQKEIDPLERGYLATSDGYYLLIDLDTCAIWYQQITY